MGQPGRAGQYQVRLQVRQSRERCRSKLLAEWLYPLRREISIHKIDDAGGATPDSERSFRIA